MKIENSIVDNTEEFDNSWSGIVSEFDIIDDGVEINEKLIERVKLIIDIDDEINQTENHLRRLKSWKNSIIGGIVHIFRFKKIERDLILDNKENYFDISIGDDCEIIIKIRSKLIK